MPRRIVTGRVVGAGRVLRARGPAAAGARSPPPSVSSTGTALLQPGARAETNREGRVERRSCGPATCRLMYRMPPRGSIPNTPERSRADATSSPAGAKWSQGRIRRAKSRQDGRYGKADEAGQQRLALRRRRSLHANVVGRVEGDSVRAEGDATSKRPWSSSGARTALLDAPTGVTTWGSTAAHRRARKAVPRSSPSPRRGRTRPPSAPRPSSSNDSRASTAATSIFASARSPLHPVTRDPARTTADAYARRHDAHRSRSRQLGLRRSCLTTRLAARRWLRDGGDAVPPDRSRRPSLRHGLRIVGSWRSSSPRWAPRRWPRRRSRRSATSRGTSRSSSVLGVGAGTAKLTIDEHRAVDVALNAAFARALRDSQRVPHLALMTSAGADPTASERGSGAAGMSRYRRVKGEAEQAVRDGGPPIAFRRNEVGSRDGGVRRGA